MTIKELGWNSYFAAMWQKYANSALLAARVVGQQRGLWRVAGDFPECWAAVSGKLRAEVEGGGAWPALGDWVAAEIASGDERAVIQGVLPRRSQFVRKVAGKRVEEQVIATNVDTALVMMALDGDFNPRRLERYLAQCWESGAKPVVVLNKADACGGAQARVEEVERISMGAQVILLSALSGQGTSELEAFLVAGQTLVLLGSSGVGKSTLLNRLLGRERQAVRAVREKDSRGRHTTTARELFALPGGALVIDTPGLRELQLWDAVEGVAQAFADIEELAGRCRFQNCGHSSEPGCAVRAAIAAGELDTARLENLRKLQREEEFLRRKIDPGAQHTEKERVKKLMRGVRQMYERREKDGGRR
jgi:ribosome biogenesis GTPase / thiamine phosphate phosphatase